MVVAGASEILVAALGAGLTGVDADFFVGAFLDFFAVALVPVDVFFVARLAAGAGATGSLAAT